MRAYIPISWNHVHYDHNPDYYYWFEQVVFALDSRHEVFFGGHEDRMAAEIRRLNCERLVITTRTSQYYSAA